MITFGITPLERRLAGEFLGCATLGPLIHRRYSDDSEGKRVKLVCAFWDERYCKNRTITDVDWSPKVCPSREDTLDLLIRLGSVSGTQCCIIQ
jgi:hypothetical protein